MPANRKRSRKQQFQPGNQTRTKWAARPAAAGSGGGRGGDGEGVHSPADFPYNLHDRKPWDQRQKSALGKMHLVHVDKKCHMCNFATEHLKLNKCSRPKFQPAKEEKSGVVVAVIVVCELQLCYTTL